MFTRPRLKTACAVTTGTVRDAGVYQKGMRAILTGILSAALVVPAACGAAASPGRSRAMKASAVVSGKGADSTFFSSQERPAADSSSVSLERSPLLQLPARYALPRMTMMFSTEPRLMPDFTGYTLRRRSRSEMALIGAGSAASIGLAAGAMGEMLGAWDEDASWIIGGVMAAVGAIYGGGVKADDSSWNLDVRWDPHQGGRGKR